MKSTRCDNSKENCTSTACGCGLKTSYLHDRVFWYNIVNWHLMYLQEIVFWDHSVYCNIIYSDLEQLALWLCGIWLWYGYVCIYLVILFCTIIIILHGTVISLKKIINYKICLFTSACLLYRTNNKLIFHGIINLTFLPFSKCWKNDIAKCNRYFAVKLHEKSIYTLWLFFSLKLLMQYIIIEPCV